MPDVLLEESLHLDVRVWELAVFMIASRVGVDEVIEYLAIKENTLRGIISERSAT